MVTHGDYAEQATLCRTGSAACRKLVEKKYRSRETLQQKGLLQIIGIEVAGPLDVHFVPIIFHDRIFSSVFPAQLFCPIR